MGWKIEADWDTLSEWERYEWLAEDYRRQELLNSFLKPFEDRIKQGEGVDVTAFYTLLLETL
jgi:hypothetical protein